MTASGGADRFPGPPAAAGARKPAPGQPWSHLETVYLIEAYEEKWYSLKRGQLKAQQWEEVAAAVAARCGFDGLCKTGTQCRHKIEKLRKRYRAERLRPNSSAWPFFDRMDSMERGPLPISVRLPARPTAASGGDGPSSEEEEDDEDDEEEERMASNTRSINGILREGNWGFSRVSRNRTSRKRRVFEEEEEDDDNDEEEEEGPGGRGEALLQLAAVVRRFGEGLVRMEKKKMEISRDVERDWMETEAKRAEMMMESQRCLVDTIAHAFSALKKAKKSQICENARSCTHPNPHPF